MDLGRGPRKPAKDLPGFVRQLCEHLFRCRNRGELVTRSMNLITSTDDGRAILIYRLLNQFIDWHRTFKGDSCLPSWNLGSLLSV